MLIDHKSLNQKYLTFVVDQDYTANWNANQGYIADWIISQIVIFFYKCSNLCLFLTRQIFPYAIQCIEKYLSDALLRQFWMLSKV